jgi:hypothetical protein
MTRVPETLAGKRIEWIGVNHSKQGEPPPISDAIQLFFFSIL